MNRTIKDATVKRSCYETHEQLRAHLRDFVDAYNFARRLKTLRGLTPYEFICKAWTSQRHRFKINPLQQTPGRNLLDRVEVWGVFRQEHEAGADVPDRLAHRLSFVGAEIVEDHDVARLQRRGEDLVDIGAEALAVDGSFEQEGASTRLLRKAARKVAVCHLPCGTLSRRSPFGAQPRSLVMLVFVQVSSTKIRRLGSMSR